jgi:nicotinamidase-related amidase
MALRLRPETTTLIHIDWQERLFGVMPAPQREEALRKAGDLSWLAGELQVPVLCSEQYPRGLGPTVAGLGQPHTIEKITFSALQEPRFVQALRVADRQDILLTGMETHICVAQTAADLLERQHRVWVVADAVLSRREEDRRWGLERMQAQGALVITAEVALFELIERAGTPLFKEVSRRVR